MTNSHPFRTLTLLFLLSALALPAAAASPQIPTVCAAAPRAAPALRPDFPDASAPRSSGEPLCLARSGPSPLSPGTGPGGPAVRSSTFSTIFSTAASPAPLPSASPAARPSPAVSRLGLTVSTARLVQLRDFLKMLLLVSLVLLVGLVLLEAVLTVRGRRVRVYVAGPDGSQKRKLQTLRLRPRDSLLVLDYLRAPEARCFLVVLRAQAARQHSGQVLLLQLGLQIVRHPVGACPGSTYCITVRPL